LIDAGKGSMLPDAPKGAPLKDHLPRADFVDADGLLDPAFAKLRAEADAWQKARSEFMVVRLSAGRHPDTDPDFWTGYIESPAPVLPTKSVPETYHERMEMRQRLSLLVVIGVPAVALICCVGLAALRSRRARRRKSARHNNGEFA
jgi:hypothetical protein